jgi:urea transporter
MCAAVINGLVAPILTRQLLTAEESEKQLLHLVLMNNGLLNQGFAKVFVVASCLSLIFWSVAIVKMSRFAQAIAVIGCLVGLLSLAAFFGGHLRLNVHGFGLFVFAQSLWTILLGVFLLRSNDSSQVA